MATISLGRRSKTRPAASLDRSLLGRDWKLAWLFLLPLTVVLVGLIAYPFVAAIVGTWSWSIFSASKQVDAGKALIKEIMQPDKLQAVYEKVGGRWYPVYRDLATAKFWKDRPYFDAFPEAIKTASPTWTPTQATPDLLTQLSAVDQKLIVSEMLQDVVVSNKSPQEAAKAAQTKMEQAFAEAIKK